MEKKIFKQHYNKFSSTMLSNILNKETVAFSPLSALIMLAIAVMAAKGKTQEEIVSAIMGGKNADDFIEMVKNIQKQITKNNAITSSNAVCVNKKIEETLLKSFSGKLEQFFCGKLIISDNIVDDVNDWVNQKTKGMIPQIADNNMSEMLACLVNAIYFEDEWMYPYLEESIKKGWFVNVDGNKQRAMMMCKMESISLENEYFTGFSKPYKNGFSYVGLLPKKENSESFIKNAIENTNITELLSKQVPHYVYTEIPEHVISFGKELIPIFQKLGIETMFSLQSDMGNLSTEWLVMESIMQKIKIEVNRKGTRAAVVTSGTNMGGGVPDFSEIILNRPFVFAIVHDETKLPVFTGVVNKISRTK